MKTSDPAPRLDKLLDRVALRAEAIAPALWSEPILDADQPLLNEFLRAFLIWESGVPTARATAARLARHIVDFNDLRVCLPDDLQTILGDDPLAGERAQRLRASLTDLVRRTHAVSLEHLAKMGKRESAAYLESLEGVPPFVSSRVALVAFGSHSMPMDQRTARRLVEAGAALEACPDTIAGVIERHVKAGDLLGVYAGLQQWADELADAPPTVRRPRARAGEDPPPNGKR